MTTNRILSTHTGSLPRPDRLIKSMWALADGVALDSEALANQIDEAVHDVLQRQVDAGVSCVNDGEMSKPSYATYIQDRLGGFEGESIQNYYFRDLEEFPRSRDIVAGNPGRRKRSAPACIGPVTVIDDDAVHRDMDRLEAAAADVGAASFFSSAASPGVVSLFFANDYYATREEYVFAIAEAMRSEYEAIAAAGAMVQLDCPDLAMGRHSAYAESDDDEFLKTIEINVEALNHAVRNIPAEQLRMHLCWGNYPGPHHCDVPLRDIIEVVWRAKPATVLFEGANPRHAHEWQLFRDLSVPTNKTICPGVIEPQSNYIEHPELVAQRLLNWASVVDADQLMAGTDCGFSIHVGMQGIDPDVAWAKLGSLAQGCELASARIFS